MRKFFFPIPTSLRAAGRGRRRGGAGRGSIKAIAAHKSNRFECRRSRAPVTDVVPIKSPSLLFFYRLSTECLPGFPLVCFPERRYLIAIGRVLFFYLEGFTYACWK